MIGAVKKGFEHWNDRLWWRKVAFPYAARAIHSYLPHQGIHLPDEDWDNLLILDACRYDMFAEQSELAGELRKRTSVASNTPEFLQSNFQGGDFNDTVYVTANPQINVHLDDEFFKKVNVWEDHWDDDLHTVPPDVMAAETLAAYRENPKKRLIAHFIQPHYPFIGDIGQNELAGHSGMELSKRLATGEEGLRDRKSIWNQLYERTVSRELVWRAYRENLDLTLPYVQQLLDTFEGRTVVTSDHGNAMGERAWPVPVRIYGHPPGIRIPALVNVPWLEIEKGERKMIVAEESTTQTSDEEAVIEERLADLGYK